jgi:hypothetical protein
MLRDRRNPFEPESDGAPLQLTFDSRSLSSLDHQERADADFLMSLSHTERVDGLVAWALPGFAEDLPAVETRPTAGRPDDLTVSLTDDPKGFIGGVPMSGQWARMAAEHELSACESEWFVHYGQVTAFHFHAGRHFFVTADPKLLRDRQEGPFRRIWQRHRVISVHQALALVGALMRIYGRSYDRVEGNYRHYLTNYTLFFMLAGAALPNRLRLAHRWLRSREDDEPGTREMQRLQQSLFDRSMDLLRAREYTQRENLRVEHNNATVDEILYHLRAAVASLAAACDSLAWLSCLALELPDSVVTDRQRVGFGVSEFRRALRDNRGPELAAVASSAGPVLRLLKLFRDPIIHETGPSGSPLFHIGTPSFSETRADITAEQREALEGLGKHSGRPERWGLRVWGIHASMDPVAFVNQLAVEGIALLDELLGALCDDLGVPSDPVELPTPEPTLRRVGLLAGLSSGGV